MSTKLKPFRCEKSGCPNLPFYSNLVKPVCPHCDSGESVTKLAVIHWLSPDPSGDQMTAEGVRVSIACGVTKYHHATDNPALATCHECVQNYTSFQEKEAEEVVPMTVESPLAKV